MTISDLRRIVEKSGADIRNFSFSPSEPLLCEDMFCIREDKEGFEAYIAVRYEIIWSSGICDENTACNELLKKIRFYIPWYKFEE